MLAGNVTLQSVTLRPEAGTWSLSVGSRSHHSVRVGGRSALAFAPAFSASPPGGHEGNRRPLLGTPNYMTITLSETNSTTTLSHAELLDLEGKPLFELPLRSLVDEDRRVYATDAFMPPEELFFIAINGRDETNQELRRVEHNHCPSETTRGSIHHSD
ncbi:unnamed protein product [Plutella xylostella]|uniref:(diamondback moth) hypothetical protein n=1 Tax=Plutella xylostella TaxID=51655 RepID=A0A8S4FRN4_PLUXY|nr:unnamed protein product [Plutella xylostella]